MHEAQGRCTRSVSDSGIKGNADDANIKWLVGSGQASYMLEMGECRDAAETPLPFCELHGVILKISMAIHRLTISSRALPMVNRLPEWGLVPGYHRMRRWIDMGRGI